MLKNPYSQISISLCQTILGTPLGQMIAVANDEFLYLLEFEDQKGLSRQLQQIEKRFKKKILSAETFPIESIRSELDQYFRGTLQTFQTPIFWLGTPFQDRVWKELQKIPFGQTRSYSDLASCIQHPTAQRAVARANSTNPLAIIVPCHRVIEKGGGLGGYAGGINRKEQLLRHESEYLS